MKTQTLFITTIMLYFLIGTIPTATKYTGNKVQLQIEISATTNKIYIYARNTTGSFVQFFYESSSHLAEIALNWHSQYTTTYLTNNTPTTITSFEPADGINQFEASCMNSTYQINLENTTQTYAKSPIEFRYVNQYGTPQNSVCSYLQLEKRITTQSQAVCRDTAQNMTTSIVKFKFNIVNNANATQFYEYLNANQTINVTLGKLQYANDILAYQILTPTASPIQNAIITAKWVKLGIGNSSNYRILGQRLTDVNGKTLFYTDQYSELQITINATGYQIATDQFGTDEQSSTWDTPITRTLFPTDKQTYQLLIQVPTAYSNLSSTVWYTIINANTARKIYMTTNYRRNAGLGRYLLQKNNLGTYTGTLVPGVDYIDKTNITIYIYNTSTATTPIDYRIIQYIPQTKQYVPTTITKEYFIIAFIMLILLSGIVSVTLPTANGSGFTVFMIGLPLLSYFMGTWYLIGSALTSAVYFIFNAWHKKISET